MISIIVTSYDDSRIESIKKLLDSISHQSLDDWELLYVVERNYSLYERIASIFRSKKHTGQAILANERLGLAASRNLGVEIAKGSLIGFVDDDIVLDRRWCEAIRDGFDNLKDVVGATGPAFPLWSSVPISWLPLELDWLIGCTRWIDLTAPARVTNVWGMNMCFRKTALQVSGPFLKGSGMTSGQQSGEIGEDVEMSIRITRSTGGRIYFLPRMKVYNHVSQYRMDMPYVLRRSLRVGSDRKIMKAVKHCNEDEFTEKNLLVSLFSNLITMASIRQCRNVSELVKCVETLIVALFGLGFGFLIQSSYD